jgi:hypothetical protein
MARKIRTPHSGSWAGGVRNGMVCIGVAQWRPCGLPLVAAAVMMVLVTVAVQRVEALGAVEEGGGVELVGD